VIRKSFSHPWLRSIPHWSSSATTKYVPPFETRRQDLANRMGTVMGTSHQETLARNTPEWNIYGIGDGNFTTDSENLTAFWIYGAERAAGKDRLFTVGMRGNGDIHLVGANILVGLIGSWA